MRVTTNDINTAFMKHVLSFKDGKPISLGEAQRLAKIDMIDTKDDTTYNKLQYSLLGDPALSLNLPTLNVVIDSINGIALNNENQITLKGGSIATVKGHIEKASEKGEELQWTDVGNCARHPRTDNLQGARGGYEKAFYLLRPPKSAV